MKVFNRLWIFTLIIFSVTIVSCNRIIMTKGGMTYRYIYKGATLYKSLEKEIRGDSIGLVTATELIAFKEYLDYFWSGEKYWRFNYRDKEVYINIDNTGWEKSALRDSSETIGYLIVKTVILEGVNEGQEKETMKITILDSSINHDGVNYAPTINPDGKILYYVADCEGGKLTKKGKPSHDFWAVTKKNKYDTVYSAAFNIDTSDNNDRGINTIHNEGVASIAANGKTLYFTACNRVDRIGSCDIYRSKIIDGVWGRPINLGREINTTDWNSQPSISPDGKRLYFISNREGPNGEKNHDIWYSDWDADYEEWLPAHNMIELNTEGEEAAPFIAPDNETLFFASDGYDDNIGGLDFYVTKYDRESERWSEPTMLKRPINTEYDEKFITLPASGDMIYFSSEREDIPGFQGDLDIFMAFVPTFFKAIVIKVYVADDSKFDIETFITVENPLSGRIMKEKLMKIDNIMGMVLTNADYGRVRDSIEFIDLDIKAINRKHGTHMKTLRVKNPLLEESKGGWIFDNEVDVTFEISVSPELEKRLRKMGRTILDARVSASGEQDGEEIPEPKIVVEEFLSSIMRPLLNYVFFDENSSKIPIRYKSKTQEDKNRFDLDKFQNHGALETYYELLNIVGQRMEIYPESTLRLVGCNSKDERDASNLEISTARARAVSNYLQEVWGIAGKRILVEAKNLPSNPSNNITDEGREENRRVEIYSDDVRILEPISTYDKLIISKPEIINFFGNVSVKGGQATWTLTASQDGKKLKEFSGEGSVHKNLMWEINKEKSTLPKTDSPLKFELIVKDKKKDKAIVSKGKLTVQQITTIQKQKELKGDKRIDRFSLILFDFGSSEMNENNIEVIEKIKEYLNENSNINVIGFTDSAGNDKYNLRLSEKRAESVANYFGGENINTFGVGESKQLYDNDLPEGRFYCRTVEVIVETPIENNVSDHDDQPKR